MSNSNESVPAERFEIIIVTLSNGHIIPIMLDKTEGKSWQGHLVGGNLSWRHILEYDEASMHMNNAPINRRMSEPYR